MANEIYEVAFEIIDPEGDSGLIGELAPGVAILGEEVQAVNIRVEVF